MYLMFPNADDSPEQVSNIHERLIGYLAPRKNNPCREVCRFDDTYIVEIPKNHPMIAEIKQLLETEENQEWLQMEN